jgi:hypothetical protein
VSSSPFPVVIAVERSRRIMLAYSAVMLLVSISMVASEDGTAARGGDI